MKTTIKTILVLIVAWILLIGGVSAESEYCTPPTNYTVTLDQSGSWYNFTISYPSCYVCVDNGAGYGDVTCTPCSDSVPTVAFTTNVTCGIVPFSVQFTDTSYGANITDYYWMFGEGNTSVEENPIFQYNLTGAFTVNHSATNEYGTSWRNESYLIQARPFGDTCAASIGGYSTYEVQGSSGIAWAAPFILAGAGIGILLIRRPKNGNGGTFGT